MTNLNVAVPDAIYQRVATLEVGGIADGRLFGATRGARFLEVIAKVPDVEPEEFDQLN